MSGNVGVDLLEWCSKEADRQVLWGTKVLEVQWLCLGLCLFLGGQKGGRRRGVWGVD